MLKTFDDLSNTGVNMTLVKHESAVILGDLETLAAELSNLPNDLPVRLDYKKKDFIKQIFLLLKVSLTLLYNKGLYYYT